MIEFGQPLALWTGLAVAMPILAHLAYRRIAQKLPFSSLRFLRSSTIPRSGRRKPSDWTMLWLRIIIFLLLALLLADPYWQEKEPASPQALDRSERLFLLDSTPSMGGWGAWQAGLSEIRSRLEQDSDVRFGLLLFQDGSLLEWPTGTSREELLSLLDQVKLQNSPAGLQAMIDRAPALFSSGLHSKKIVLISDFQRSSWQEIAGNFSEDEIELEFFPVGHGDSYWQDRTGNRAIVDAKVAPAGQEKVRVWAALRNFDDNRTDCNVSLVAGGTIRQTTQVRLAPQGTEQLQFVLPAKDYAHALVQIEGNDSYLSDDKQALWILPPPPRIFGFWKKPEEDNTDTLEEQFLRAAIESAGDGLWNRWQENDERAKELRLGMEGTPIDLLMVLGISGWFEDEDLAPSLLDHLEKGGEVIMTPPLESHVRMNQALKESGLLDFTFGGINRTAFRMEPYRIEVLPENSRLSKVFSGDSVRDLYLSQIRQFIKVDEGEGVDVPLFDRSGRPLVLTRSFPGGGKLVFFTFRMIPEWTDLPMRNSFLPLLVELGSLHAKDQGNGGTLRLQAGEHQEISQTLVETKEIGLLQVGDQRIEVVHPLVESMPEVMSKNELLDALAGGRLLAGDADSILPSPHPDEAQSLWPWIAMFVSLLLVVEMIVSAPSFVSTNKEEVVSG